MHRTFGARGPRAQPRQAPVAFGAVALSLLVLYLPAQSAPGEIFKCTANKAMPTYQNFPCEFDSLGAVPPAVPAANAGVPSSAAPHPPPETPVPMMPQVGMTAAEVKAIWGTPIDMTKEEYAKGNIETWMYADSRSIRFDLKGRVTQVKW